MWINSLFHRIVLLTKQFDKWLMLGPVLDSAYFGERSFGLGAEIQVFNSPWWTERKNGKTQARTGLGICYLQGKGKSFTTSVSSRCDVLSTFDLSCLYVLYDNFPDIWGQDLQQMQKCLQQEESRIPKFKQKVEEAKVRNSLKSNAQWLFLYSIMFNIQFLFTIETDKWL